MLLLGVLAVFGDGCWLFGYMRLGLGLVGLEGCHRGGLFGSSCGNGCDGGGFNDSDPARML